MGNATESRYNIRESLAIGVILPEGVDVKLGVCTGGGDCPGLNAAIRGVVKRAIGTYGMEVYGIKDSFDGLMSKPRGVRKLEMNDVTDLCFCQILCH